MTYGSHKSQSCCFSLITFPSILFRVRWNLSIAALVLALQKVVRSLSMSRRRQISRIILLSTSFPLSDNKAIGVPIALLSDNGNEVDSSIMREICRLLDIDKLRTTFCKASTNAAIERFHRTLNSMLGKVISEKQHDWDLWLPYVMAAYRSSRHDST